MWTACFRAGIAAPLVMASLAWLGGCAQYRAPVPKSIGDYEFTSTASKTRVSAAQHADNVFTDSLADSAATPTDPAKAQAMLETGFAAVNIDCERYLHDLGTANQNSLNARQQTTIAGGFITSIMGLYGSAAADISAVSALASTAASSQDTSNSIFLFTDAYKTISKIVHDAQNAYLANLQAQNVARLSYSQSVNLLARYASLCQPTEIRRLIDEAVQAAQLTAKSPGTDAPTQELTTVLQALTTALKTNVAEGDAISLYAWFLHPEPAVGAAPSTRDAIEAGSPFVAQVKRSAAANDNNTLAGLLGSIFTPLSIAGDPLASRWATPASKVQGVPSGGKVQQFATGVSTISIVAPPSVSVVVK